MIDIVIHGINGRMGQVLCELISQRQDCRVAAGVDLRPSDGPIPVVSRFADLPVKGDVVIDFSTASAVDEMLAKTSTTYAPWHILESVDKKYARIKALKIVVKELEKALE